MNAKPTHREKILIVDDHVSLRSSLRDWLSITFPNYDLLEAGDSKNAIQIATQSQPSLILMDIELPDVNGLETARVILEKSPDANIIILSIHDERNYRLHAKEIGVSAFVAKALMRTQLLPTIAKIFSDNNHQ